MNEFLVKFLAYVGAISLMVSVGLALVMAKIALCEWVDKLKYKYRYKHRFDKPPTAKCFCRDCRRHGDETGRCYKFEGWYVADNWFCWDAEPRDRKFEKEKEK